ncbi:MAG: hypothetical protein B7X07_02475 [Actinobacteria bacterium 21-64-8]|nr:MAG: hypothetical protein B7X07_02475 [Actinobacteria bacterium 21-64-8]
MGSTCPITLTTRRVASLLRDYESKDVQRRRFLGVDLAVRPQNTGVALLDLRTDSLDASLAGVSAADDATLVSLVDRHTVVGLDAPLGWPVDFVKAIKRHGACETDRFVKETTGTSPLSVSADLIGGVAMRAAGLQVQWAAMWGAPQPRDGTGRLVEVYPRPALHAWQLLQGRATYKGATTARKRSEQRAQRECMLASLLGRAPWLHLAPELLEACVASDHVFDALISALVAYASRVRRWRGGFIFLVAHSIFSIPRLFEVLDPEYVATTGGRAELLVDVNHGEIRGFVEGNDARRGVVETFELTQVRHLHEAAESVSSVRAQHERVPLVGETRSLTRDGELTKAYEPRTCPMPCDAD